MSRPTSLDSLPLEIFGRISHFLDPSSAISFALTARRFSAPADFGIWRRINLSLNPYFGQRPSVQPVDTGDEDEYLEWEEVELSAADRFHQEGLQDKMKKILLRGAGKRLGMVEEVTLVPRYGAIPSMIHILDLVSAKVQRLEICSIVTSPRSTHNLVHPETLDLRLLESDISFASLNHLRVDTQSLQFVEVIPLLCNSSPNLTTVEVDFVGCREPPSWKDFQVEPFPKFKGDTKIRSLHIAFDDHVEEGRNSYESMDHPILGLLKASPLLQQVSIQYDQHSCMHKLAKALSDLPQLHSLSFSGRNGEIFGHSWMNTSTCTVLRMVISVSQEFHLSHALPKLNALQSLHIRHTPWRPAVPDRPPPVPTSDHAASVTVLYPDLAERLRECPQLTVLHDLFNLELQKGLGIFEQLDTIESTGILTGHIRSWRHGKAELLHARLFRHETTIPVVVSLGGDRDEGSIAVHPEGLWQDMTDIEGYTVPMSVIEEMERVQGGVTGQRERGMEVSDGAWKVLMDWKQDAEYAW